MPSSISWETCYVPSQNVVAREIGGEIVIVPLTGGIGDLEDDLFTLNATGAAIWQACDGRTTLRQVAEKLKATFVGSTETIEQDVVRFVEELCARDILMPQSA